MALPGILGMIGDTVASAVGYFSQDDKAKVQETAIADSDSENEEVIEDESGIGLNNKIKSATSAEKETGPTDTPPMPDPKTDPTAAQKWLNEYGGADISVDGVFGENSLAALKAYNDENGPAPGTVVPKQDKPTKTPGGTAYSTPSGDPIVIPDDPRAMQQMLVDAGYDIAVDGKPGQGTQRALNRFMVEKGITGVNAANLTNKAAELGIPIKQFGTKDTPGKPYKVNGETPSYAQNEMASGGDLDPQTVEAFTGMMTNYGEGISRITGGNDAYHVSDEYLTKKMHLAPKDLDDAGKLDYLRKNYRSKHNTGDAVDFTVDDPVQYLAQLKTKGWTGPHKDKRGNDWYKGPNGEKMLDEYKGRTSGTAGAHFHFVGDGFHK